MLRTEGVVKMLIFLTVMQKQFFIEDVSVKKDEKENVFIK